MESFENFVKRGDVKKTSINTQLATALLKEAEQRIEFYLELPITEKSAKYIFENCYEALREMADAQLSLEGYKSYSHEASIAFLQNKKFTEFEISKLNDMRWLRNGTKYYGKSMEISKAIEFINFTKQIKEKFK